MGGLALALIVIFFHTPVHTKLVVATWKEKLLYLDVPGVSILLAAAVCFFLAMQWSGATKVWSSGPVIDILVASASLLVI